MPILKPMGISGKSLGSNWVGLSEMSMFEAGPCRAAQTLPYCLNRSLTIRFQPDLAGLGAGHSTRKRVFDYACYYARRRCRGPGRSAHGRGGEKPDPRDPSPARWEPN